MKEFTVRTSARCEMIDITAKVADLVREDKMVSGLCFVFVPHTTAAVTINENADPAVPADMLGALARLVPEKGPYRHGEGNSDAHIKASLVGASETIIVAGGELALGTWQAVFLCEYDGPRHRKIFVKLVRTP